MPIKKPIYMREFPTSWRDIDKSVDKMWTTWNGTCNVEIEI
jgi:hypothetical protein